MPLIESPVSIISIALRMPRNQGWKCMSGTPKRTAGYPICASSATYTRSQPVASSLPPARQNPCTCAMTGLARSQIDIQPSDVAGPVTVAAGRVERELVALVAPAEVVAGRERRARATDDRHADVGILIVGAQPLED